MLPRWLALVVTLLVMATIGMAGNCTQVETITMKRAFSWYEVTGGGVVVSAAFNDAKVGNNFFSWQVDTAVERRKIMRPNSETDPTPYEYVCTTPESPGVLGSQITRFGDLFFGNGSILDPIGQLYGPGFCDPQLPNSCGDVVSYVRYEQFDCWADHIHDTILGLPRERVVVHFSDPLSNYTFFTSYELVDSPLNYTYSDPITGHEMHVNYRPDELKINLEFFDFPFRNTDPVIEAHTPVGVFTNHTFSDLWWNITGHYDRSSSVHVLRDLDDFAVAITSHDGEIRLALTIQIMALLDGVPQSSQSPLHINVTLPDMPPNAFIFNTGMPVCPMAHGNWRHLWYDPTFTVLFTGSPTEPNSPQAKSNHTVAIAVGVSVGVVVLAIIVLAILVLTVPAVKTIFRPFAQRSATPASTHGSTEMESKKETGGWSRGSKPSH